MSKINLKRQTIDNSLTLEKVVSDFLNGNDWNITNSNNNATITGVREPSNDADVANKKYVDELRIYSLLNISNWSEFVETNPTFSIGDEINYMGNHYKNKTNSFSNTLSPDNDNTNWELIKYGEELSFSNGLKKEGSSVSLGGEVSGEVNINIEGALILGDSDPYDPNAVSLMVASNDIVLSSRTMILKMVDGETSFEDKRNYGNKKGVQLLSYSLDDLQYDSLVPKEYVDRVTGNLAKSYQIEEFNIIQQTLDTGTFTLSVTEGIEVRSVSINLNGVTLRNGCISTVSNSDYEVSNSGVVTLTNPSDFEVGDNLYIQYVYTPSGA